jgi:hypothetical protein
VREQRQVRNGGVKDGAHSINNPDSLVNWGVPTVAVQQELGILAKRGNRNNSFDRSYSSASRENMKDSIRL